VIPEAICLRKVDTRRIAAHGIRGTPSLGLRQLAGDQPQHFDLITRQGRRQWCHSSMPRRRIADGESIDVNRECLPLGVAARPALLAAAARCHDDYQQQGPSQAHAPWTIK
jgi:hypothetical protein